MRNNGLNGCYFGLRAITLLYNPFGLVHGGISSSAQKALAVWVRQIFQGAAASNSLPRILNRPPTLILNTPSVVYDEILTFVFQHCL